MKRTSLTCIALIGALFAFASVAAAAKPDKPDKPATAKNVAAQQCAALKKADRAAFKAVYGKGAMAKCIKSQTKASGGELKNAAKQCKAEQAADPVAFEETYGDDDPYNTSNNAFGKCVSSKVRGENADDTETFKNAAKACKAERAEDRAAFEEKYGSEKSKRSNAFGKCVSSTVKNTRS